MNQQYESPCEGRQPDGRRERGHQRVWRALPAGRRRDRAGRRERGSTSVFVVAFTPAVLLLAGLLVDGGMAINARQRAADIAGQAARYAANDISIVGLRTGGGTVRLKDDAWTRCGDVVARYEGVTSWDCDVGDQVVEATVTITYEMQLLGLLPGVNEFTITAHSQASAVSGI